MSFMAIRDALVALTDVPGRHVAFSSIVEECKRRGTTVTRDDVAATAGTLHDYGYATKYESTVTWDGLIVLGPKGAKASIFYSAETHPDVGRYPVQHFEHVRPEEPISVHLYVVPAIP